jgi:hypothetical protein
MAKRPIERFTTAGEFAGAVDRALAERPARRPFASAPTPITRVLPEAGARSGGRGRMAAFAALAAAALGVGIAAGASGTGTTGHSRPVARAHALGRPLVAKRATPAAPQTTASKPKPATSASTTASTSTSTKPAPTTSTPSPSPAPPAGALEAQGHQLMNGGNYGNAIPVLRQAVATAAPASLTYAYALYDLGRSLRLAGDPRAAVPILWRRLQIPNQTGVVRTELTLALHALGQQGGGSTPGANSTHGQGHGRSADNQAAPSGNGPGD